MRRSSDPLTCVQTRQTMTDTDRLGSERRFHDRQAAERAEAFRSGQASLVFTDEQYLDHESWVRPAFARLGDVRGKQVLDYGCGHGMAAVVLARAGAVVTAFDLSPGYVAEARRRAEANRVRVSCLVANAEQLPFPDACFDLVWGNAVLHHLDLHRAGKELARILKPSGRAVFCEPWGGNPLLALARRRLPYPGKHHTPDEAPLTGRDLAPLRDWFPALQVRGYQFLGMVRRVWPNSWVVRLCDRADAHLLRQFPALASWCRYVVIVLPKPGPLEP